MANPQSIVDNPFFCLADAVLAPLLLGTAKAAVAAARAVHRACCVRRETRVASVLGVPTPDDVRAVWTPPRRTLREALLIGSKLVDLSAIHPATRRRDPGRANGKCRFRGREGGLKRYFAAALPDLPYPTAMRYRRLALRLLRVLGTPAALPLEWMLSPAHPVLPGGDPALAAALRDGRRKLAGILANVRSQRDLERFLDRRADSDRLPISLHAAATGPGAAICDEILRRGEEKLSRVFASGRPPTPAEKRAWAQLAKLRKLAKIFAPGE